MEWLDIAKLALGGIGLLAGGVVVGRYFPKAPGGRAAFEKREAEARAKPLPPSAPKPPPSSPRPNFLKDEQ
jgi:hypothetical protein